MGFLPCFLTLLFLVFTSILSPATCAENFVQCLVSNSNASTSITNILYSPNNSSYSSVLDFSSQNLIFASSSTPKPQYIITPQQESHIQAAVICSKRHGLLIRVRSGGHDYEGLSYISYKPFVVIDLVNFQKIDVNLKENTAWVQAGATVGQVYYRISEKSSTLAFPAGVCSTMGVGGHIGGGGLGFLMRKYGLSVDNVLDAYFIDVNGRILDRKSMGEDIFWAIRGGGGASFGIIVSWKIRLVPVPSTVTVSNSPRTLEQGGTSLYHKWQTIAPKLPNDIVMRTVVQAMTVGGRRTIQVLFQAVFLGTVDKLLPIMQSNFPELGLTANECSQMSWVRSTLSVAGLSGQPVSVLLSRSQQSKNYFKGKSDFVQKAISITDLESIWKVMLDDQRSPMLINEPLGGRMDEISESAVPFPHRRGNLYNIQYYVSWGDGSATQSYLESSRRLHKHMTPYVSKSPRAAYVNYKDLDLGVNKDVNTSYQEASRWGEMYFKSNFARLATVKTRVDPENYFWNEQSIPPFSPK